MEESTAQQLLTTVFKHTALRGSAPENTASISRKAKCGDEAKLTRRNKAG